MKKMTKSALLIGLGVGGAMAYKKFQKPIKKEVEKVLDKTIRKNDNKLEEMM